MDRPFLGNRPIDSRPNPPLPNRRPLVPSIPHQPGSLSESPAPRQSCRDHQDLRLRLSTHTTTIAFAVPIYSVVCYSLPSATHSGNVYTCFLLPSGIALRTDAALLHSRRPSASSRKLIVAGVYPCPSVLRFLRPSPSLERPHKRQATSAVSSRAAYHVPSPSASRLGCKNLPPLRLRPSIHSGSIASRAFITSHSYREESVNMPLALQAPCAFPASLLPPDRTAVSYTYTRVPAAILLWNVSSDLNIQFSESSTQIPNAVHAQEIHFIVTATEHRRPSFEVCLSRLLYCGQSIYNVCHATIRSHSRFTRLAPIVAIALTARRVFIGKSGHEFFPSCVFMSERDGCVKQGVRISQLSPISFHCLFDLRHNVRPYEAPLVIAAISSPAPPQER
ncbi:hypothetical protein B0H19DRAFT_1273702 [Mycena capillaripes]|nr:hypothetical protein B0H19DRAFT_1273702 [Mycena capillaripes]